LLSSDGYLTGRVHRVAVAAQGLNLVTIEVPALLRQSYLYAGQYVKMRPKKQATAEATEEFKTAFFAILSPPDFVTASSPVPRNSDTKASAVVLLTFLVKDIPNHAFLFTHSQSIEMSLAHGTGFGIEDLPMDDSAQHDGRGHTLFVATGSGLAPIAAALESRRPKQAPRMADSSATLLLGVRSPAHLPLHEQLFLWAHERQVQIILVFSQAFEPSALSIPAALERPEHATMMVMSISSTLELNYKQLSFGTCVFPSKQRHQQGLQVPCMFGGYVQDYLQAHWYLQGSLVPPVYPPALESAMPPPQQQQQEHSQLPQEPPLQQQEEEETKTTKKTMHVFVCGQRGMTNRVRELCVEAGVPAKHILTNC
jgi:ferredoxin-NADP reductase